MVVPPNALTLNSVAFEDTQNLWNIFFRAAHLLFIWHPVRYPVSYRMYSTVRSPCSTTVVQYGVHLHGVVFEIPVRTSTVTYRHVYTVQYSLLHQIFIDGFCVRQRTTTTTYILYCNLKNNMTHHTTTVLLCCWCTYCYSTRTPYRCGRYHSCGALLTEVNVPSISPSEIYLWIQYNRLPIKALPAFWTLEFSQVL